MRIYFPGVNGYLFPAKDLSIVPVRFVKNKSLYDRWQITTIFDDGKFWLSCTDDLGLVWYLFVDGRQNMRLDQEKKSMWKWNANRMMLILADGAGEDMVMIPFGCTDAVRKENVDTEYKLSCDSQKVREWIGYSLDLAHVEFQDE